RSMFPISPPNAGTSPEELADRVQAQAWFRREKATLLSVMDFMGTQQEAWQLGWMLSDLFELAGQFDDWIALQTQAVAAAREGAPYEVLARCLHLMGSAHFMAGQYTAGRVHLAEAVALFRAIGDYRWQARTLTSIGYAHEQEGRFDKALEFGLQALDLVQAGD